MKSNLKSCYKYIQLLIFIKLEMIFWKLLVRFILAITLGEMLFLGLERRVIATPKFNQDNTLQLITSSDERDFQEKSRLNRSLEMVNQMDNSQLKVILLNDLALDYAQAGDPEKAIAILEQSLSIAESFEDKALKVTTMNNIAMFYAQIGQKDRAIEILDNSVEITSDVTDKFLQGQLLLDISSKYREIGEEESAQTLFAQSQTIIAEGSQPLPEFPFTETPATFRLGFSGSVNSFRNTTAYVGVELDFAKQWSEDDIFFDGLVALDFDSGRSVNNYRPTALSINVYRHHFNTDWNFFNNVVLTTNQDIFASRNDDGDLSILAATYFGGGYNLWRGDSPREFLDLQIGVGPRYEYDFIEFEQRRNETNPVLGIFLLGRSISIGEAKLNHLAGFIPALNDFDNFILASDTNFSIPLSERWSFMNRLFIRYRNQEIFEENPKVRFLFTTGLEYKF
ncbi:MAG: tetratricopeptide repeat protein [Xenococcaceae cyanobacterium]